ncbi:MAG: hypothetical protein KAJ58_01855 [Candidatus Pacebacteria bacterium]|nr:hypothetical protein [Candidatus Paceibacterota bacterium]
MKIQNQKGFIPTLILIIVGVLVVGSGVVYLSKPTLVDDIEHIACTEEAKLCPDGSAVGRIAPDCEFAECPEFSESNQ